MALFDLRKRRANRASSEFAANLEAPLPLAQVAVAVAPPTESAVADPGVMTLALGTAGGSVVAPTEWADGLQQAALDLVPRGQDTLVLGLAPWGTVYWPPKLHGRARAIVALDSDKARLSAVRPYCHRTIETTLEGNDWLTRLGNQRFGMVLLGDGLTHQTDPVAFLRRVRACLTPDGQVVAIVPNAVFGDRRLDLLQGELPREFEVGAPLHRYNRDRLREVLALAGFTLAEAVSHHAPLMQPGSALVAEAFPPDVLAALGPLDDATTSHFLLRATPTTAESLLSTLFVEQEALRKAVRNELAKANRTHEALSEAARNSDYMRKKLEKERDDDRHQLVAQQEATARAEQNVRRLVNELEQAKAQLNAVQTSLAYRVMAFFAPARRVPDTTPGEPELVPWKVEEPKSRYL